MFSENAVQAPQRSNHICMLVEWPILDGEVIVLSIAACNKMRLSTESFLSNTYAKHRDTHTTGLFDEFDVYTIS